MASWQGWHEVPGGGRTPGGPGVSENPDVFVRGMDDTVFHNRLLGGSQWSGWQQLPGLTTSSAPATTVQHSNVYVFARANDGRIFYTRWDGVAAVSWQEVPGGERTDAAVGVAAGVLVARRADGGIRFNTFDGAGPILSWRGWADVPHEGRTPSAPAITEFGAGFFLFVRGTDDGIHYKSLGSDRVSWGVWQRVDGGATPSAPAVAKGTLVVRGTDNGLHHNSFDGGSRWNGWQRVPGDGVTPDAPGFAHNQGFFTLVARGMDNGIHFNLLA
jgi:hypothetical protein